MAAVTTTGSSGKEIQSLVCTRKKKAGGQYSAGKQNNRQSETDRLKLWCQDPGIG